MTIIPIAVVGPLRFGHIMYVRRSHHMMGVLRFSALDSTSIGVLRLSPLWAAVVEIRQCAPIDLIPTIVGMGGGADNDDEPR